MPAKRWSPSGWLCIELSISKDCLLSSPGGKAQPTHHSYQTLHSKGEQSLLRCSAGSLCTQAAEEKKGKAKKAKKKAAKAAKGVVLPNIISAALLCLIPTWATLSREG